MQKEKITLIAILLAGSCFLTYYFHGILQTGTVFTHLFYIPIILATLWWKRKGLAVAIFLAVFLIFSNHFLKEYVTTSDDYLRALMFVAIGFVVATLSQRIAKTERMIRETRDYLDNLFNYANAPIIVWNPESKITEFNHAFEHMTGLTADEVIGKELRILFPEASRDNSLKKISSTLSGEYWESVEIPILCKDGDIRIALWNSANIYTEDGTTVIATIAQGQDITERKKAEEKLRKHSENLEEMVEQRTKELKDTQEQLIRKEKLAMLGQLAGGVGHELRNPLGVISNAIYYLKTVLSEADESTREYLSIISSEVGNADKIVTDLLDFSRTRPAEREEIAGSELVAKTLEKSQPPENVKVTTKIPSDLPPVFIDPLQIGQVLVNLVTNAYHAMPEGGRLTISAQAEKENVSLSITDTGYGISKENMEKLFEPLFTTRARGIGLGLSVSKNLVEGNGGSIEVESPSAALGTGEEGKGSTFTIILPIKEVVS